MALLWGIPRLGLGAGGPLEEENPGLSKVPRTLIPEAFSGEACPRAAELPLAPTTVPPLPLALLHSGHHMPKKRNGDGHVPPGFYPILGCPGHDLDSHDSSS